MASAFQFITMIIGFMMTAFGIVNGIILLDEPKNEEQATNLAGIKFDNKNYTAEERILAHNQLRDYKNAELEYEKTDKDFSAKIAMAPTFYDTNRPDDFKNIFDSQNNALNQEDFFDDSNSIKKYGKRISSLIETDTSKVYLTDINCFKFPECFSMDYQNERKEFKNLPYDYDLQFQNHDYYPRMKLQDFITDFITYFSFIIGGIFGAGILIIFLIIRHFREEQISSKKEEYGEVY